MKTATLFESIERISSLIRAEERKKCAALGLQSVHLQVLTYLSICNKYSDTPAAVANFLGMTRGTVSQSLLLLERKGYIKKTIDSSDRRVMRLGLLPPGSDVLHQAKLTDLFCQASIHLKHNRKTEYETVIAAVLAALQKANGSYTFGLCKTCRFFTATGDQFICGLTQEPLTQGDSEKICQEHTLT